MAKILDIRGRQVWDSRGRPTVEAEVVVGRGTTPLAMGRAIAPAGASTGSGEAKSVDVPKAVHNIGTRIRDGLRALSVSDQAKIDERLIDLDGTPDRSRLGANAMVAVSLACAHADAAAEKVPLWKKLAGDRRVALPVPQIQIFGGGAHARGRCDVQDYMIVCIGAGTSPRLSNGRRRCTQRRESGSRSAARSRGWLTKAATGRRSRRTKKA